MIPVATPSFLWLFLVFVLPVLLITGGLYLVAKLLYRFAVPPAKSTPVKMLALLAVVLGLSVVCCNAWFEKRARQWKQEDAQQLSRIESRRILTLEEDRPLGEIVIPAGSTVYRVDNFDGGRQNYPITFTDEFVVRLAKPLLIAGIWAEAIDTHSLTSMYPKLLVSTDQMIQGKPCLKGQVAEFDNFDHYHQDKLDANGHLLPPPEGKEAWFNPGIWRFMACSDRELRSFEIPPR